VATRVGSCVCFVQAGNDLAELAKRIWGKHPIAPAKFFCLGYDIMNNGQILPAREPVSAPFQHEPKPTHRILVVDDDREIRSLAAAALVQSGYKVDAVEDGAVAWDTLQVNSYDLLVTDHNMPKVSGVELLKKLHAARMALPIILMTGAPPMEELKRHPWLQIKTMLLKPFTADELFDAVRNVLHAPDGAREQLAPQTNWHSQPPANGLQMDASTPQSASN
jgi:CheY-like chemotaxis protein